MNVSFELNAQIRAGAGKGASRRLRREYKVPAILYGGGKEPQPVVLDHNELARKLEHEAFYSHILNVKVGERVERAVLRDLQRHPYKPVIMHVDLQRVSETEELRMRVPLHFIGADIAPGVKQAGGVVSHAMVDVEVACLPKDLPEYIEVDVSQLNIGEAIHLSALNLPADVKLVELLHGGPDHDLPVVAIHHARVAEVEAAPAEAVPAEGAEQPAAAAGTAAQEGPKAS